MSKVVAIIQSNYIPWKGYFDIINMCDEFMLFDEAQYTRNDWRNRNKIKTANGLLWLTIPIARDYGQRIDEATVQDHLWAKKHLRTLQQSYAKAGSFKSYFPKIEAIYAQIAEETHLSRINYIMLTELCKLLGITTRFTWSTDYQSEEGRVERVLSLCKQAQATEYISGPSAKSYMDDNLFEQNAVKVTYMSYEGYREYPQVHPPFEHGVSVLDLLLNMGDDAPQYLLSAPK